MRFSSIQDAVDSIAQGEIVIVVDAEDRENEGDFVCAAEKVTPELENFMITHGRGLLCVSLLPDDCDRLQLPPIVDYNTTPLQTAFEFVENLPVHHQRDLIYSFIREMHSLVKKTAAKEISDQVKK